MTKTQTKALQLPSFTSSKQMDLRKELEETALTRSPNSQHNNNKRIEKWTSTTLIGKANKYK